MKQQSGFTLIELILVIVILGILAATALPRFANLQGDARLAKMQAAIGAMKSAAAMAHSAYLAAGTASNVSVTMEGVAITMANGYPTADASGIIAAANLSTDYSTSTDGSVYPDATHRTATTCGVVYANADPPTYTNQSLDSTNCQ